MSIFGGMTPAERRLMLQTWGLSILGFLVGVAAMTWWLINR